MKTILKLTFVLLTLLTWVCCEYEETPGNETPGPIQLKSGQEFRYDFKILGDEEGATIISQARHAEISEIIRNESTGWSVVYHYKPVQGFTGSDSVAIETCTGGDGNGCTEIKQVDFIFLISD